MSVRLVVSAFVLGAFVMAIGLFLTPMITDVSTDATTSVELVDNESEEVQQYLEVEPDINSTNGNATVTVTNTRTFDSKTTVELATGEEDTVALSGENVTVRNSAFSDPEVVLDVTYPPTFAYDDGPKLFYEHLGTLLAILGLLIALSGLFLGGIDA